MGWVTRTRVHVLVVAAGEGLANLGFQSPSSNARRVANPQRGSTRAEGKSRRQTQRRQRSAAATAGRLGQRPSKTNVTCLCKTEETLSLRVEAWRKFGLTRESPGLGGPGRTTLERLAREPHRTRHPRHHHPLSRPSGGPSRSISSSGRFCFASGTLGGSTSPRRPHPNSDPFRAWTRCGRHLQTGT